MNYARMEAQGRTSVLRCDQFDLTVFTDFPRNSDGFWVPCKWADSLLYSS